MSYGQIHEKFWNDGKVRQLTPFDMLLFIYLFSNPQRHFCGVYYLRPTIIADETKVPVEQVDEGLTRLEELGLIEYDRDTFTLWVRNMLKYSNGSGKNLSPTQLKGIAKQLTSLEPSKVFAGFIRHYLECFQATIDRQNDPKGF